MEELQKKIIEVFREEHQDWVSHIKEAETSGEGIDINLGGNFAVRVEKILQSFSDFRERHKAKKGWFGR